MVHFGVVVVVNIMIGLITPPYGLLLFIMTNIAGVPLRDIVRDMLPFLFAMIVALALITFVPETRALAAAPARLPGLSRPERRRMTKPIYVLNGPNLNRLGTREPEIYGTTTLAEIEAMCRDGGRRRADRLPPDRTAKTQLDRLDPRGDRRRAPASSSTRPAFTFTSIALLDALKMFPGPIIELHISNIHRREPIYHNSLVSTVATAVIAGLGARGYPVAVARHAGPPRSVGRRVATGSRRSAGTRRVGFSSYGMASMPSALPTVAFHSLAAAGRRALPSPSARSPASAS